MHALFLIDYNLRGWRCCAVWRFGRGKRLSTDDSSEI